MLVNANHRSGNNRDFVVRNEICSVECPLFFSAANSRDLSILAPSLQNYPGRNKGVSAVLRLLLCVFLFICSAGIACNKPAAESQPIARPINLKSISSADILGWHGKRFPFSLPTSSQNASDLNKTLLLMFNPSCHDCVEDLISFINSFDRQNWPYRTVAVGFGCAPDNFASQTGDTPGWDFAFFDEVTWYAGSPWCVVINDSQVVEAIFQGSQEFHNYCKTVLPLNIDPLKQQRIDDWIDVARNAERSFTRESGHPLIDVALYPPMITRAVAGSSYPVLLRVANISDAEDVQIQSVTSDCSCTTVSHQKNDLLPGEIAYIQLVYTPKHAGRTMSSVLVQTVSKSATDSKAVRVTAESVAKFTVSPQAQFKLASQKKFTVLINYPSDDWRYLGALTSSRDDQRIFDHVKDRALSHRAVQPLSIEIDPSKATELTSLAQTWMGIFLRESEGVEQPELAIAGINVLITGSGQSSFGLLPTVLDVTEEQLVQLNHEPPFLAGDAISVNHRDQRIVFRVNADELSPRLIRSAFTGIVDNDNPRRPSSFLAERREIGLATIMAIFKR
jgi:hypothetical protein